MRTTKSLTVGLILALLLGAGTVFADVSPLSGLTAEWWQVMSSIPTPVNPGLDQTGADCMVGQRGPVWFLAGNFFTGATTTIRTCSVPEGEWLFFPVVNIVNYNSPNLCGQTGSLGVDMLRSQIAPLIDAAADLSVKVDGQPVNMVRVKSLPFAITVPADSVLSAQCIAQGNGTLPAGIYSPAVDDGFYTLVSPLSKGKHTIHIQGQIQIPPSFGLTVDITYNLTIVPVLLQ